MKSDKIEILLEGLTEDLSEIKKKTQTRGSGDLKKDIELLGGLNSQLSKKIDDMIDTQQKTTGVLKLLVEAQKKLSHQQDQSQGVFGGIDDETQDEERPSFARHLREIVWPFPRLVWTLLFSAILLGVGYFKYYQPIQDRADRLFYKDQWMRRAYPSQYEHASIFYSENQAVVDRATDSLRIVVQKERQDIIEQKQKELEKLQDL